MSEIDPAPAPPQWQPDGPSGPRASFGRRLVAIIVDGLVLGVVYVIARALFNETAGGLVNLVVGIGYFTYFEGGPTGQTLGKRALDIRVIDIRAGGPLGYGRGFIRYLARFLSTIACLLGYFWMLWDKEKQTWHDKLASSVVVPVQYYPVS
jgi:uncharacterized RDD family membrane protein YckC